MRFTIVLGVLEHFLVLVLLALLVASGCGRKPAPTADSPPPAATPRGDGSPSSSSDDALLKDSRGGQVRPAERASQGPPASPAALGSNGGSGASGPAGSSGKNSAAAALNEQIDRFNLARAPGKGIRPIYDKVQRLVYDGRSDTIWCFDDRGVFFLTLTRQADHTFAGRLQVEFREPAAPGGKAASGHLPAAFTLPDSLVSQLESTTP